MKKNKKALIAAGFAFLFAVASYFGVELPPALQGPAVELTCNITGWC